MSSRGSPCDFNRHMGRRRSRGPEACLREYPGTDLQSGVDDLADWRSYFWPFTRDHRWDQTPRGFRRAFPSLLVERDSRALNPVTGNRDSRYSEHETRDRQDRDRQPALRTTPAWDPLALVAIGCRVPEEAPVVTDLARAVPRAGRALSGKTVRRQLDAAVKNPIQPATAIPECDRDHRGSSTTQSVAVP